MKRNTYHPAIGCSCGLHTWPTLLQSVCKKSYLNIYGIQKMKSCPNIYGIDCSLVQVKFFHRRLRYFIHISNGKFVT